MLGNPPCQSSPRFPPAPWYPPPRLMPKSLPYWKNLASAASSASSLNSPYSVNGLPVKSSSSGWDALPALGAPSAAFAGRAYASAQRHAKTKEYPSSLLEVEVDAGIQKAHAERLQDEGTA